MLIYGRAAEGYGDLRMLVININPSTFIICKNGTTNNIFED